MSDERVGPEDRREADPTQSLIYRLLAQEDTRINERIAKHAERHLEELATMGATVKKHDDELSEIRIWRAKVGVWVLVIVSVGTIGGGLVQQWLGRALGLHP